MKRQDVIKALKALLPLCQRCENRYLQLGSQNNIPRRNSLYILSWQRYAQCAAEIEIKLRSYGGEAEPLATGETIDPEAEMEIRRRFEETLSAVLPFDVRMLLQRHVMIFKDIAHQLKTCEA